MNNQHQAYPAISKAYLSDLKKLQQKKFRKAEQKVLVEGWNLIEQLIANKIYPEQVISTSPDKLCMQFPDLDCAVLTAKEHELKTLAETDTPQSIVAVYRLPMHELTSYKALIYLDGIQDPGNLGTIFRISAAFGFDGIVLSPDCAEVFSPKVIRASLGSVFWIPSVTVNEAWLSEQKSEKLGLIANSEISLRDVELDSKMPVIIIVGSEAHGIRDVVKAALTREVYIPISTQMESLNAAMAVSIAAYEVSQRLFLLT